MDYDIICLEYDIIVHVIVNIIYDIIGMIWTSFTMMSSRELFFWTVNRYDTSMDYDIIGLEYDIIVKVNIIVNIIYDIIGMI
jgi:hypothetical protein